MSESLTILDVAEGAAVLTLNRPAKRNALSRVLRDEIVERLDELTKNSDVRAVVLTGAGPVFCAGFDRSEFAGGSMAEVFADATEYHRRVFTFPKPLIAAVNGPALGGGCDLAAMCDFRLAAASAAFGQPQVRFGAAAAYELMRVVVGTGMAREMCLTGRPVDELLESATALARDLASLPEDIPESAKRVFVAHQPRLFES